MTSSIRQRQHVAESQRDAERRLRAQQAEAVCNVADKLMSGEVEAYEAGVALLVMFDWVREGANR